MPNLKITWIELFSLGIVSRKETSTLSQCKDRAPQPSIMWGHSQPGGGGSASQGGKSCCHKSNSSCQKKKLLEKANISITMRDLRHLFCSGNFCTSFLKIKKRVMSHFDSYEMRFLETRMKLFPIETSLLNSSLSIGVRLLYNKGAYQRGGHVYSIERWAVMIRSTSATTTRTSACDATQTELSNFARSLLGLIHTGRGMRRARKLEHFFLWCCLLAVWIRTRYHTRAIWYQLESPQGSRVDIKLLEGDI